VGTLPSEVQIGPFCWTVRKDGRLDDFGVTYPEALEIILRDGLPDELERETLFHELLHAVLFVQGVPSGRQERWVRRLSPLLFELLGQPEVRKFLWGRRSVR